MVSNCWAFLALAEVEQPTPAHGQAAALHFSVGLLKGCASAVEQVCKIKYPTDGCGFTGGSCNN